MIINCISGGYFVVSPFKYIPQSILLDIYKHLTTGTNHYTFDFRYHTGEHMYVYCKWENQQWNISCRERIKENNGYIYFAYVYAPLDKKVYCILDADKDCGGSCVGIFTVTRFKAAL